MAIHGDLKALTEEVIDEYVAVANHCLNARKPDGGVYGYPAVLLLFCVVDALSSHLGMDRYSLGVLNEPCFDLKLSAEQMPKLKTWYRNLLAHNGMIAPGTILTLDEGDGKPFGFSPDGQPTTIRVLPFSRKVAEAWKAFDKTKLQPEAFINANPQTPSIVPSATVDIGASGAYITPRQKPRRQTCP